jgi:hypothetical protein
MLSCWVNKHRNYQLLSASSEDGVWEYILMPINGSGFIVLVEKLPIGGDMEGRK